MSKEPHDSKESKDPKESKPSSVPTPQTVPTPQMLLVEYCLKPENQKTRMQPWIQDSIHHRRAYIDSFLFWGNQYRFEQIDDFTPFAIESYRRSLFHSSGGKSLDFTMRFNRLLSVAEWFGWVTEKGYLPTNPMAEVPLSRRRRRIPATHLNKTEILRLIYAPEFSIPMDVADRAVLEDFYWNYSLRWDNWEEFQRVHNLNP